MIKSYKKNNTTLCVTKTHEPVVTEHEYKLDFLLQQKDNILSDKERCVAECDANLQEVEELIAHCREHGITEESYIQSAPVTKESMIEEIKNLVIKELELLKPIEVEKPIPVMEEKPQEPVVIKKLTFLDKLKQLFR
jgi:hypothetical protein